MTLKVLLFWIVAEIIVVGGVAIIPPVTTFPPPITKNCGYQSCHPIKKDLINVHLVPHTHDDVGWLKTVDQYYYGSKEGIQNAAVKYILDSVIDSLKKSPDRKFIYVETSYFWKWWSRQHDFVKHSVKTLINNGQLEFISGGWSMNDEAVTNYQSIIDQFTWGLRQLNESFGICGQPKVGWQIDPFGHSKQMASIFAQLGFDGLLLGRIDYQDKELRFKTQTAEMIWQASSSLGDKSNLFTSIMYNVYAPPKGFYFDINNSDDPIIDSKKSPEYNVDAKIDLFIDHLNNISKVYTTNNVIITMGEDFNYMYAESWYKNLDLLIKYTNQRQSNGSKYNLFYSTPSCYIKAVHDSAKDQVKTWPVKSDDFFPYASDPNSYWTGYFTSRPTMKRFERIGNNYLQVCKQLYAIADLGPEDSVDLDALREAMGVLQHHDAITGTEKQAVAHDYARQLSEGIAECDIITSVALNKIISQKSADDASPDSESNIPFTSCLLTNISSCPFTEQNKNFVVTVYNPLSKPVSKYVRLPVTGTAYKAQYPDGTELLTELIPIPEIILNTPGRESNATVELILYVDNIPPLGFKSVYVTSQKGNHVVQESSVNDHYLGGISFRIDPSTGLISSLSMNGVALPLTQQLLYYQGFVGPNRNASERSSGAYIFRPFGSDPIPLASKASIKIYRGSVVSEVQQQFNDWAGQTIRIYRDEEFIEFDWVVGPLPGRLNSTANYHGREVISRFSTPLKSQSVFYTDSNGRELLRRVRNQRPSWPVTLAEPVAGNYYPVTSRILLRDPAANVEMAVLTDRAQGGSSLHDGELELMVHRECFHDDGFGVDEALIETAFKTGLVARGSHYLVVGSYINNTGGNSRAAQERDLAQRKLLDSWIFLSPSEGLPVEEYPTKYKVKYSGLTRSLPPNVQILTLEPWKGFSFLLRLEHVFEKNEDSDLSKPVDVDLKGLFTSFSITSIKETTLGANQWLEDNQRLDFDANEFINLVKRDTFTVREDPEDLIVTLSPMQIRTFVIEVTHNTL